MQQNANSVVARPACLFERRNSHFKIEIEPSIALQERVSHETNPTTWKHEEAPQYTKKTHTKKEKKKKKDKLQIKGSSEKRFMTTGHQPYYGSQEDKP